MLNTFCMNTHGGMHSEAIDFLKTLAAFAVEANPLRWTYNGALRYIVTDVTNTFHTANGCYIASAIELIRIRLRQSIVHSQPAAAPFGDAQMI